MKKEEIFAEYKCRPAIDSKDLPPVKIAPPIQENRRIMMLYKEHLWIEFIYWDEEGHKTLFRECSRCHIGMSDAIE